MSEALQHFPDSESDRLMVEMFIASAGLPLFPANAPMLKTTGWKFTEVEKEKLTASHSIFSLEGKTGEQLLAQKKLTITIPREWRKELPLSMKIAADPREVAIPKNLRQWIINAEPADNIEKMIDRDKQKWEELLSMNLNSKMGNIRDYLELAYHYKLANPTQMMSVFAARTGSVTMPIRTNTGVSNDRQVLVSNDMINCDGVQIYSYPNNLAVNYFAMAPIIFSTTQYSLKENQDIR